MSNNENKEESQGPKVQDQSKEAPKDEKKSEYKGNNPGGSASKDQKTA